MSTWKRKIVRKLSLKKNVVFIGVHNRRTDYKNHYKVVSNSVLVDQVYFNAAFKIYRYYISSFYIYYRVSSKSFGETSNIQSFYRKKYNDDKNQVVFLAVSDDNEWIKVK